MMTEKRIALQTVFLELESEGGPVWPANVGSPFVAAPAPRESLAPRLGDDASDSALAGSMKDLNMEEAGVADRAARIRAGEHVARATHAGWP